MLQTPLDTIRHGPDTTRYHHTCIMYGLYGLKHHIVEISGDVTDAGRDEQTTSKDSATQLLISEPLSLAMKGKGRIYFNFKVFAHWSVIDHPL